MVALWHGPELGETASLVILAGMGVAAIAVPFLRLQLETLKRKQVLLFEEQKQAIRFRREVELHAFKMEQANKVKHLTN